VTEYSDDEPVSWFDVSPAQMPNPDSGPTLPLKKRQISETDLGEANDLTCFKRVRVISKSSRDKSGSLSQDINNTRSDKDKARTIEDESSWRTTSFVNGAGIDREVITRDICRYLGNDALVKPGTYQVTTPFPSRFVNFHQCLMFISA
jgi:hypothetical protein